MRKMQKHAFEPVSLLTVENGLLNLAVIPASNQPDWLVPKSLILAIEPYDERIWTYLWRGQEIAVHHLHARDEVVDKLVVLEGNTDVHRLALQTSGEIRYLDVRIADVKDVTLSESVMAQMIENMPSMLPNVAEQRELDYMYQAVMINGKTYIVPELDLIVHRLVDLDS